uniref:Uncharacterized protein n=1 Tax=Anopheles arabiensis TaxID=7173 RepID=A0A182IGK3_ANOAR
MFRGAQTHTHTNPCSSLFECKVSVAND